MSAPQTPLRFGLFPSFFYTKDDGSGELAGFGVELARRLAEALARPLEFREYAAPPAVAAALRNGGCDVAAMGIDPGRGLEVDFSPPWLRADFTFLVPAGSDIGRITELDRPGRRIAVVRNHAMDFALEGQLPSAERVFAATPDEALAMVRAGQADYLAGIRPGLLRYADLLPGSRVLEERYGENVLAFAVAKGQGALLSSVAAFVMEARRSGLLRRIIEETGLSGVKA